MGKYILIPIILLILTVGLLYYFINQKNELSKLKLVTIYDIAIERQPALQRFYFATKKMPQKAEDIFEFIEGLRYTRASLQKIFDFKLGVPSDKGLNTDELEKLIFDKTIEIGKSYQLFWDIEISILKNGFDENITDEAFLDYFLNPRFHPDVYYYKILSIEKKYEFKKIELVNLCHNCFIFKMHQEDKVLENKIKMQIDEFKKKIQQTH